MSSKIETFSVQDAIERINTAQGVASAKPMLVDKSVRQMALEEAIRLTVGQRDKEYGSPYVNMSILAGMVRAYLADREVTAADMAAINILIKLSRLASNPTHRDSWIDAAAYAGIGLECALSEKAKNGAKD